ncbi:hypothetical protein [Paenarthrobacter aromaticivorans]|uniref:hypothetical protein n=1 Tax=Paenarthrobacter aromaticivorans TaxID=2849150 RepID=UPI003A80F230
MDEHDADPRGDEGPLPYQYDKDVVEDVGEAADIGAAEESSQERLAGGPTSVRKVLNLLRREPAVTAEMIEEHTDSSLATAYRAVERLETAGILASAGKIRGTRVWVASDIVAALDAFADRAGRRTRH